MSRLLALAYSDIHKYSFPAFAKEKYSRFKMSLSVEEYISKQAKELKVPVLFCGDMFHDPKSLENYILEESIAHFGKHFHKNSIQFYAISGNHDMSEKNLKDNISPTYLRAFDKMGFSNFNLVDNKRETIGAGVDVYGIPYYHDDSYFFERIKELNRKLKTEKHYNRRSILLIHRDIPGAATPLGFKTEDIQGFPKKIDKLWDNFTWVLSGHIHKPQQLSDKCFMLGSPIHQTTGDIGCEMGYWKVYDDKVKFISLNHLFPTFIQLGPGEEPYNDKDYFLPFIEDKKEDNKEGTITFSTSLTPKKLVKRYFKAKGLKNKTQRRILTNLLIDAKNDNI